ncbi:hypothetical protein [Streptomyces sp. NPDC127112]|uniref:hypothetical protein n=1 Tax=Streptomyces sp. NPDC127112 TaxID=3345364 RepID=UPI003626A1C5
MAALQDRQVLLMLYGRGPDRPPTDPDGFRERVDQLGSPAMSELAAPIVPNTPIHPYAKLINRRRLYHRMPSWPDRFLVLMSRVGHSPQLHHALLQIYQLLPPTASCEPRAVLAACRPGGQFRRRRT